MMAEMGAEVIKVELTPNGDPARGGPYLSKDGRSGYFVQHNRGKKAICVNVKTPEGHDIIDGLIRKSDVLVENYSPGTIGRHGIRLRARQGAQSQNCDVLDFRIRADRAARA